MASPNKMSKKEIAVKFASLQDAALRKNKERFIPMVHKKNHKLHEFGLYDYKTKKYTLGSVHASNAAMILKEISMMLEK